LIEGALKDTRPTVAVIDHDLRRFRVSFYELFRERLDERGVRLALIYSTPLGKEGGRGDHVDLPWAHRVEQRHLRLGRYEVTWQPVQGLVKDVDLVIVQQAMRRLQNYILMAREMMHGPPVALWGHGRNFQATSRLQNLTEAGKRFISRRAHWFFAYNDLSAEILGQIGYPADRLTVVGNSIDTRALAAARDRVTADDRVALREELGIVGERVGIFVGSMYEEKRLPFLVEAAVAIRELVPGFELICVGSGDQSDIIEGAARSHEWIHYVGPRFGDELARYFSLARVFLLPGLVGLAVLDSFVVGVPLVTTTEALHSPEISYLENGVNGLMVEGDGSGGSYVDAVVRVLTDDALHNRLVNGCLASAEHYSIEAMSERYADGVVEALAAGRRGRGR
jgi:glycosyltransferase involved in cell wall biosynthesis